METEGLFRTPGNSKSLFLIKSLKILETISLALERAKANPQLAREVGTERVLS